MTRFAQRSSAFSLNSSSSPPRTRPIAVQMRNAPKMKKTHVKVAMAAAPTAMKMPRSTSAITMPAISTVCCACFGTANRVRITMNTNRLSTLRLFSVTNPPKYSAACSPPENAHTPRPNSAARPM